MSKIRSAMAVITTLLFILFLTAPLAARMLSLGTQTPEMIADTEKRLMFEIPQIKPGALRYRVIRRLPTLLDSYLTDTFPYRLGIISLLRPVQAITFKSPNTKGVVGKDSWLFNNDVDGKSIDDYHGKSTFSDDSIQKVIRVLEDKRRFFAERGITYYFLLVPNKVTIHDEMLPDALRQLKGTTFRMRFMETYLRLLGEGLTGDFIIDPTERLLALKQAQWPLYYPLDTHWNWKGRIIGGEYLWERIRRDFPDLASYPSISMSPRLGKADLPPLLGLKIVDSIVGEAPFPDPKQWDGIAIQNEAGESLISEKFYSEYVPYAHYINNTFTTKMGLCIIGDSFFGSFHPFPEALRFKNTWFYWPTHNKPTGIRECGEYISGKDIDIVVEEWVERFLHHLPQEFE